MQHAQVGLHGLGPRKAQNVIEILYAIILPRACSVRKGPDFNGFRKQGAQNYLDKILVKKQISGAGLDDTIIIDPT